MPLQSRPVLEGRIEGVVRGRRLRSLALILLVVAMTLSGSRSMVQGPPVAALASSRAGTAARAVSTMAGGIDVSEFQGTIDWAAVDHGTVGFAIVRATKGRSYVDPLYATNVSEATANGFVIGAYHRAKPDEASGDAAAEADHFIAVARNAAGDVLPVLDVEEAGRLSVAQLQDWVRRWLARVHTKLGVRPMIYAGPNFWRRSMGNTRWFARHGYPLWIAHWNVPSPDVPAHDWDGNGWTYWQWTSTGAFTGISGDVDRDRFYGRNLRRGQIGSLSVGSAAGGIVTASRIACGDGSIDCTRLANPGDKLTLTATPDPDARFLGWTGPCARAGGSRTCTVTVLGDLATSAVFGYRARVSLQGTGSGTVKSSPAGLDCGTTCAAVFPAGTSLMLTAAADSASTFGSWSGACAGSATTCALSVDAPVNAGAAFDATTQLPEDGPGARFAWGRVRDARSIGGSYRWERRGGASQTFAFRGGAVTLFTIAGPAMGNAAVAIDGLPVGTIHGYARSFRAGVADRLTHLGAGDHTITVTVAGTSSTKATDTRVGVDALRWEGITRQDPRPASGTWASRANPSAGGGSYVLSDVPGATASLRFTGTGVTWITARGPSGGRAEIWIDGSLVRTTNLYTSSRVFGVQRTVTGLSDASHLVKIRVAGTRSADATGTSVVVDGWIIR
jgi:GH25 family lysozyme M1 (1,4-beta-N-acetylmuramidase)